MEVQHAPVTPLGVQDPSSTTSGTLTLSLQKVHDLTQAMAGTPSCSPTKGKSSNVNDSRDTEKFDKVARDIGRAINNLDKEKTNETVTRDENAESKPKPNECIGTPVIVFDSRSTNISSSQAPTPGPDVAAQQIPDDERYSVRTSEIRRPPAEAFSYFPPPPELKQWPINKTRQGNPHVNPPPLANPPLIDSRQTFIIGRNLASAVHDKYKGLFDNALLLTKPDLNAYECMKSVSRILKKPEQHL